MPDAHPANPALSKGRVFARRLLSSVVLWTVVLSALFSQHAFLANGVFLLVMLALTGFGLMEFYGLVERRGLPCFKEWGVFGGLLLAVSTFAYLSGLLGEQDTPAKANDFATSIVIFFVLGLCLRQLFHPTNSNGLVAVATTLFGLMYVAWLLNFIQNIYYFPRIDQHGPYYVLYFILVTKFSDTGAYMVGSLIGRHKMIPRISPGKTWEGMFGACLFAAIVGSLFALAVEGLSPLQGALFGIVFAFAGQLGDLAESMLKRDSELKDSGSKVPGFGGALDVLDSPIATAAPAYLFFHLFLQNGMG